MDLQTEERWRGALQQVGRDTVRAELEMVPGRPTDLVYKYGDGPPFPTRAFCEQWCRGERRRSVGVSGNTAVVIAMAALITVSILGAISSWSNPHGHNAQMPMAPLAPQLSAGTSNSDDTIQNNSVVSTIDNRTISPACSSVSDSGNVHTVQSAPPCRKSLAPSARHGDASHSEP